MSSEGRPEPPEVVEVISSSPAELVELLFVDVASRSSVPVIALREVVENLVHARFAGVVVTVLDEGRLVRCADSGPGIADHERALQDGYTSATAEHRELIRGVGSGLPIASRAMRAVGGGLTLDENLGGGAVLALHAPDAPARQLGGTATSSAHAALALLLEMGPADPQRLAAELDCPLGRCGRDLVLLEHRGLVARESDGSRRLTESGAAMISTLF